MASATKRSNVAAAVKRLRTLALAREDGAFLGNEDALETALAVSKPTIRQAARMLEREGLLSVRRGNSGGYFAARPDAGFIEATVASYLEVLNARPEDLTRVASALWIATIEQAVMTPAQNRAALAKRFRRELARLPDDASFAAVQRIENELRRDVFALVAWPYVELIFNINANFARRKFERSPADSNDGDSQQCFTPEWRKATATLIGAIENGDGEIAVIAAKRGRRLMHSRLWPEEAADGTAATLFNLSVQNRT